MIIKLYYSLAKFYFLLFVNTYRKLASEIFNVDPNVIWTRNIQSRRKTHYLSATGTFGLSWCYCVRFIYLGQIWVSSKNWTTLPMAWWRNGSASDSSSEGCVFKSRRAQMLLFYFLFEWRGVKNILLKGICPDSVLVVVARILWCNSISVTNLCPNNENEYGL